MNAPERLDLPDIQSSPDTRALAIDAVGIKALRYPLALRSGEITLSTIATADMTVALPATTRGTHMSRFVELMERQQHALDASGLCALARAMLRRLDAPRGAIALRFPWFVRKSAPVSGVTSLVDCDVQWRVEVAADADAQDAHAQFAMAVVAPATSLCPCSREISEYGAHNQRSLITVDVALPGAEDGPAAELSIGELVSIAERAASCEVYGLLKRVDEKHVTERAYDNPRFVEDLVREIGVALQRDVRVGAWRVEAENFESIHNHSAFARVCGRGAAPAVAPSGRPGA
jgi:GTP cyclohydrolase FolE2